MSGNEIELTPVMPNPNLLNRVRRYAAPVVGFAALGAGFVLVGATGEGEPDAAGAQSGNSNSEEYWEDQGYGDCVKVGGGLGETFTMPAEHAGFDWTLLVLKAGSEQSAEEPEVVIEDPNAGQTYGPIIGDNGEAKQLSHVIYCEDEEAEETTTTLAPTTTTATTTTVAATTTTQPNQTGTTTTSTTNPNQTGTTTTTSTTVPVRATTTTSPSGQPATTAATPGTAAPTD